ncbi:MAG: hypothetical protein HYR56_13535 [Acidobacteria bacterium]|nr:hypothetical protein [Acidobacteriota bacterium]
MKLLGILALALFFSSQAQAQENWLAENGLKGPVRTVFETQVMSTSPTNTSQAKPFWYFSFHRNGNLNFQVLFSGRDVRYITTNKYDLADKFTGTINTKEEYAIFTTFFRGFFFSFPYRTKTIVRGSSSVTLDENSRYKEVIHYDAAGKVAIRHVYKYQPTAKTVESFDNEGVLQSVTTTYFDAKGKILEETYSKVDGSYNQRFITDYDEQGHRTSETDFYEPENTKVIWRFNTQGKPSEQLNYGKDNNLIAKTEASYEYDSHGNWRKCQWRTEAMDQGKQIIAYTTYYREITYY